MLGVDSETHGDFHGLVEFGVFDFLQKRDRFLQRVRFFSNRSPSLGDVLAWFSHLSSPSPTAQRCFEEPWLCRPTKLVILSAAKDLLFRPSHQTPAARSPIPHQSPSTAPCPSRC